MKEEFSNAISTPLVEWTERDRDGNLMCFTLYIGKVESNLGNTRYWIGSSLGLEKGDIYFETFELAMEHAMANVKEGHKLVNVEKF